MHTYSQSVGLHWEPSIGQHAATTDDGYSAIVRTYESQTHGWVAYAPDGTKLQSSVDLSVGGARDMCARVIEAARRAAATLEKCACCGQHYSHVDATFSRCAGCYRDCPAIGRCADTKAQR